MNQPPFSVALVSACLQCLWMTAASLVSSTAAAQTLPAIFDGAAKHIVATRTIAEFPKQTFLENLVATAEGLVVTSHEDGRLLIIRPGRPAEVFASLPGKVTGIAKDSADGFVVTAFDAAGRAAVFWVSKQGKLEKTLPIQGGVFLNGIEQIGSSRYLIADSYRGAVWALDTKQGRAKLWLQSPLLERMDTKNPLPAANGIRRYDDSILISNTARMTLIRVPLKADGSAGVPSVWKEGVNVDDFAVTPDGSILAATHIYNSVIRIDRSGRVEVLAEAGQDMVGSTSVALSLDGKTAYVTTNGGMFLPPDTGVEPGRVVSLSLSN